MYNEGAERNAPHFLNEDEKNRMLWYTDSGAVKVNKIKTWREGKWFIDGIYER